MKYYILIGILILVVLGLIGFAAWQQEGLVPSSDDSVRIATSFYPLAEFAQHVGGDLVSVSNITPAGSEPHDFDPSPRDVALLHKSNVFIYNGAELEPWVPRVLPDLKKTGMAIVNATESMALVAGEEEPFDPHVWLSPKLAQEQVRAITKALSVADPSHAAIYTHNADVYIIQLGQLDKDFAAGTASCKRREIVTSHAAFAYLAKEYRLTMLPIAGLSPDEEPSPARLAEISDFVRENGVTHIFFETLVSPALSTTIANETGATTIALNPLEGLTAEDIAAGENYISVQRENLVAIRTALDCI